MTDIIFMGSPEFAVPSLLSLSENFSIVGVVTQPDRRAGRGRTLKASPVKESAKKIGIPVITPDKLLHNKDAVQQIQRWAPTLIVVCAYGKILRKEILDIPPLGCINVHASLLPRWRGASPIQAAILSGDEKTGITIMKMDEGLDTGPLLAQKEVEILPEDTAGSLEERLALVGADLLVKVLPAYLNGKIQPEPQPKNGETYAPLIKKEDGWLDFSKPAEYLARQIRAYHPWPGCFALMDGSLLKIHRACAVDSKSAEPGKMVMVDDYPAIGTKAGLLVLVEVQPSGKRSMDGKTFLMGYRHWDHWIG